MSHRDSVRMHGSNIVKIWGSNGRQIQEIVRWSSVNRKRNEDGVGNVGENGIVGENVGLGFTFGD